MKQPDKYSDYQLFKRLLKLTKPYSPYLLLILILNLVSTPLTLLSPVPLKIAIDSVIGNKPMPEYIERFLPGGLLESPNSILIFAVVLQVLIVFFIQLTGEKLTLLLRSLLLRHAQRLSFLFHESKGSADSIYRIQYDSPAIQWITVYGWIPIVSSFIMLVSMVYVIFKINTDLAFIAVLIIPVLFILTYTYRTKMRNQYRESKLLESRSLGIVQEVLTSLRIIKSFGKEEQEENRFVTQSNKGVKTKIRISIAESLFGLLVNILIATGTAFVMYVGIKNVMSGSLTLGELLMVITYLTQFYGPLQTMSQRVAGQQSQITSLQRSFELLDEIPEVDEIPNAIPIKRASGQLEFSNVSFSYNRGNEVIKDFSMNIEPGSAVGIRGPTGAGKTTLVNLITRFYDTTSGDIYLDGIDIKKYKLADLRNQFAIVLQDPVLFSASIADNIAYADPQASMEDIIRVSKAANAHNFITNLPDGYDTMVGERGMKLSGGERQRVSIARAFLKNSPILILDEPTSSVDIKTEGLIMDAVYNLMRDRTTFLITHRINTLFKCDFILEIDQNGNVVKRDNMEISTDHAFTMPH